MALILPNEKNEKNEKSRAEKQLSAYRKSRPDIFSLALLASLARKIEPELLRHLRLRLTHYFTGNERPTVGTEAALWFSSLVESRGADSLTLTPAALSLLRERLAKQPVLFEEAYDTIKTFHRSIPPVICWEEELIYYSLKPSLDERRRFELLNEIILRASKTLHTREGKGLENQISEIGGRIPAAAAEHPAFKKLLSLSHQRIRKFSNTLPAAGTVGESQELDFNDFPKRKLRIKKGINEIIIGEITGLADYHINVPDIKPLSIQAAEDLNGSKISNYIIPEGGVVTIPVRQQQTYLYAPDGNWYDVESLSPELPGEKPEDTFQYDVFLSHSYKDTAAVLELAERLKADGVRVWLDEWLHQLKDDFKPRIDEGLEDSRILLSVLSANSNESESVKFELNRFESQITFSDAPSVENRRLIVLRLDDSEIPSHLSQYDYVDWRTKSDAEYGRLLDAIIGVTFSVLKVKEPKSALIGHTGPVLSLKVSRHGQYIITGSWDQTVKIWGRFSGNLLYTLEEHTGYVTAIDVLNSVIVSGSWDTTLKVWLLGEPGKSVKTLQGHSTPVLSTSISPDGRFVISGAADGTIRLNELSSGSCLRVFNGHSGAIHSVVFTADGQQIVSGGEDGTINRWDVDSGRLLSTFEGHLEAVMAVAITPHRFQIVSGSADRTIRIWDALSGSCLKILEGHYEIITCLTISPDGKFIVSGSSDRTVRVWEIESGVCWQILETHANSVLSVAVTPDGRQIISGDSDGVLKISAFPTRQQIFETPNTEKVFYTSAKVILVGDSGVGKSGLAHRLTQDKFVETHSTDGVWATQLNLKHHSNTHDTEREIWLWDFAGQSDYRLIHQLLMDETALVILVFNPMADNYFESLVQWDRDLQKAARSSFRKLLVAGRCDRGNLIVTEKSLTDFKNEHEFAQYIQTSALTGTGCETLREAIVNHINWDAMPHQISLPVFRVLKDEIIKLKDVGRVLLTFSELRQNLEMILPDIKITLEEVKTIAGLLAGSGVVRELKFGEYILLQPEKINAYAAAVIRSVRAQVDEIGCLPEENVLAGKFDYQDMQRLEKFEEEIVLRAIYQTFISLGLCLRENTEYGVMLVFPSYFRRERPPLSGHPASLVTYKFSGVLDEIYSTLIVRLYHTRTFHKDRLWRDAVDFKTQTGKRLGLKMIRKTENSAEIEIYFDGAISDETKVIFIRYIHDHLEAQDENVIRARHYVCPNCGEPLENKRAVEIRLSKGLKDIACPICGEKINIFDSIEEKFASGTLGQHVLEMEDESRELILVGHILAVVEEAGQIFRQTSNSDWGIDGEIEFKDYEGNESGRLVHLQLKSGDSYLRKRQRDEQIIFDIKDRHAEYWLAHKNDVMLVIRTSDGDIQWMNATEYLKKHGTKSKQIVFAGEPFTALNVQRLRNKIVPHG